MKRLILIALALFISACATPKVENNADAYFNRGLAYAYKGQYDQAIYDFNKAISDCNKAIEINPRFAEAYSNRGNAYLKLDQADSGCHDLQKGCDLGNCKTLRWANERGLCR